MLMLIIVSALSGFIFISSAKGQEKKEMWPGVTAKVLLDNDKVNVTEYTFKPGSVADWHSHPANTAYLVTDAKMKVEVKDKREAINEAKAGQVMWSPAVTHKVTNVGDKDFTVVLTELK